MTLLRTAQLPLGARVRLSLVHRRFLTLGIRREDPSRVWERRAPLSPPAVSSLLASGVPDLDVEVESCHRRCFPDAHYAQAGAKIVPELSGAVDVVLGIKEPRLEDVQRLSERSRKWMMFSHTHKGQEYNMALLGALVNGGHTVIDHELLTHEDGKRVAAFGWYAGAAGAGEALCLTALALLKRGVATPLLASLHHLPRPYTFRSLEKFKKSLRKLSKRLAETPGDWGREGPIVIGVTGSGNVGQGAKAMLEAMHVEWVSHDQLPQVCKKGEAKVYACAVPPSAYLERTDGRPYDRADYFSNPASYRSVFATQIAPYLTTLINGAGWSSSFPRLMSNQDMTSLLERSQIQQKLAVVQDVTCDMNGGLEFVTKHTTIDQPYFTGPGGTLISTIDILPTELPVDASEHFSKLLVPYVRRNLEQLSAPASRSEKADGIDKALERATILRNGELQDRHRWLLPRIIPTPLPQAGTASTEAHAESSDHTTPISSTSNLASSYGVKPKKKVLLLGSGLVAGPAVDVFVQRGDVELAIGKSLSVHESPADRTASNNIAEARALAASRQGVTAVRLDVADQQAVSEAVSAADVVVSLLPAPMHPPVARLCIDHGKHLVTASYVSPEMKELHERAAARDVLLLNECGLDPGIDSMAAMRILDQAKRQGLKPTSFVSWCGGLPSPECANVPLGYKFSWSPKGVLTAALNPATYKVNNRVHSIPQRRLLRHPHTDLNHLWRGLNLEGLPNRDSLPYSEKYGMGPAEGMRDVFRGTLRYSGFTKIMDGFERMGLLGTDALGTRPASWREFLSMCVEGQRTRVDQLENEVMRPEDLQAAKEAYAWLTEEGQEELQIPGGAQTPIDILAYLMSRRLAYAPHERDMVLLHHSFGFTSPGHDPNGPERKVTASLVHYGDDKASAMSVTVGKTLAFAAGRVLDGEVKERGVTGPYAREVWEGTLERLEEAGVRVEERWA